MEAPLELMAWIRKRPAIYLGTQKNKFTALRAFLEGFSMGSEQYPQNPEAPKLDQARWDGFREFVAEHYGIDWQMNCGGWCRWIENHTKSEDEAFETFYSLFIAYQEKCGITWPNVEVV